MCLFDKRPCQNMGIGHKPEKIGKFQRRRACVMILRIHVLMLPCKATPLWLQKRSAKGTCKDQGSTPLNKTTKI
jgi:hypothetical protein